MVETNDTSFSKKTPATMDKQQKKKQKLAEELRKNLQRRRKGGLPAESSHDTV